MTAEKGEDVSGGRDVIFVFLEGGEADIPKDVRSDAVSCLMDDEGGIEERAAAWERMSWRRSPRRESLAEPSSITKVNLILD